MSNSGVVASLVVPVEDVGSVSSVAGAMVEERVERVERLHRGRASVERSAVRWSIRCSGTTRVRLVTLVTVPGAAGGRRAKLPCSG